jgi:hypothetical protein
MNIASVLGRESPVVFKRRSTSDQQDQSSAILDPALHRYGARGQHRSYLAGEPGLQLFGRRRSRIQGIQSIDLAIEGGLDCGYRGCICHPINLYSIPHPGSGAIDDMKISCQLSSRYMAMHHMVSSIGSPPGPVSFRRL